CSTSDARHDRLSKEIKNRCPVRGRSFVLRSPPSSSNLTKEKQMKFRATIISLVLFLMAGIWLIPSRGELSGRSRAVPAQLVVSPVTVQLSGFAESAPVSSLSGAAALLDSSVIQQAQEINELNTEHVRDLTPDQAAAPSYDATLPVGPTRRRRGQQAQSIV